MSSLYPVSFEVDADSRARAYLADPAISRLIEFFQRKGIAALKEEDRQEQWYADWIAYQAEHRIYVSKLSPKKYSSLGHQFDVLKLARFLEVFAYFSPAHGYSLHVSFLGLFPILMSENESLKKEAIASLEAGGLFAFGVSEKQHGSDLMSNEFTLRQTGAGLRAQGSKYYIGNANAAGMISILAKKQDDAAPGKGRRAPFAFFALRPAAAKGFGEVRKIKTLGVRAAFVGEFSVKDQEISPEDVICEGRAAWDAIFGTVTLGKFLLGFGSIGICEHAMYEAMAHLRSRMLFGEAVIHMPHIAAATARAYARLTGMKLYAYRALDYVNGASAEDRRYLLFCAVQKALVSTEGVKVLAQLSECIGAKGFESDTYFEMALRDIQMIPSLEGSTHINYIQASQFLTAYFFEPDAKRVPPGSNAAGTAVAGENSYLWQASTGGTRRVRFDDPMRAYQHLLKVGNVRRFVRQIEAFRVFMKASQSNKRLPDSADWIIAVGKCLATIAYGQLVAEHATLTNVPVAIVAVIFEQMVQSLSAQSLELSILTRRRSSIHKLIGRVYIRPHTMARHVNAVSEMMAAGVR